MLKWLRSLFHTKCVYAVMMYHYGEIGKHCYFEGIYSTEQKARAAGITEHCMRGYKYDPQIIKCPIDDDNEENWETYLMHFNGEEWVNAIRT